MTTLRIRITGIGLALAAATPLCLGAAPESPATAAPAVQASIPFIDHHNLRDWQADGREGLWIQDQRRSWYYAKLLGPCIGLDWAITIGFDTGGGSAQLDRFSSIVVPNEGRCQITSLTRSEAPPPSAKKQKQQHKITDGKAAKPE